MIIYLENENKPTVIKYFQKAELKYLSLSLEALITVLNFIFLKFKLDIFGKIVKKKKHTYLRIKFEDWISQFE